MTAMYRHSVPIQTKRLRDCNVSRANEFTYVQHELMTCRHNHTETLSARHTHTHCYTCKYVQGENCLKEREVYSFIQSPT